MWFRLPEGPRIVKVIDTVIKSIETEGRSVVFRGFREEGVGT